jgi:2-phospho-L-lactate guanylyltransferase (CobY/MobA/RfbA family)
MNKLVSDKVSVDINESEDLLAARKLAFDQAVASLVNVGGVATNIKIK